MQSPNHTANHAANKLTFLETSTASVKDDLKNADSFSDFLKKNEENMLMQSLSEHLMNLLNQKNLRIADVVRDSGLDKAYVYQIFGGMKKPSRDKLIAVAFGMHLNEEDTQRLLKIAGHSELYPKIARDALILFSIQHGKSIWQTDEALYDYGFPLLHPDN